MFTPSRGNFNTTTSQKHQSFKTFLNPLIKLLMTYRNWLFDVDGIILGEYLL